MDDSSHCASVDLSLLESGNVAATASFVRQVHARGIGLIRVSEKLHDLHQRCIAAAREYFVATPKEEKLKQKMGNDGTRDWGYVETEVKGQRGRMLQGFAGFCS